MRRLLTPDWTRRATLGGLAAGVGAGLAGFCAGEAAAEPPPEVRKIRLVYDLAFPAVCLAPLYISVDLMRLEGFEEFDFRWYGDTFAESEMFHEGSADIAMSLNIEFIRGIDRNLAVKVLGGAHLGCVEVFAGDWVSDINDLAGRRIVIQQRGRLEYLFLAGLIAYVGLDPTNDVEWIEEPDPGKWPEMLAAGEVDVVYGFPPQSLDLRERHIGHVILNTSIDDPWRHFYCCMYAARTGFVRDNPIATKRALRALYKANRLCDDDRTGTARRLLDLGIVSRLEHAHAMLNEVSYGAWRDYDPAATIRFSALRMREAGLIESAPDTILERGTDFSFLEELRREMKS